MFIVLPNSKAGLETLIKDLNSQILRRHVSLMDIHEVQIFLPRFSFDFNAKFGRILQNVCVVDCVLIELNNKIHF